MTATPFLSLNALIAFSPLGLSLVDDFTGAGAVGSIQPKLEVESAPSSRVWQATGVRGLFTYSKILAYPNLGRLGRAPAQPVATYYRVTIIAQYYDPLYPDDPRFPGQPGSGGVVFRVTPYDDNSNFKTLKPTMVSLHLLPRANYPFTATTPLLRGQVQRASGAAVPAAVVTAVEPFDDAGTTNPTSVMADSGGAFLLPLRWGDANTKIPTKVTAVDPASGKSATINVAFPYNLKNPQTITIPNP